MAIAQKVLQEMLKRRHPDYEGKLPHWNFLQATYEGGREWFKDNVFRYIKEGDKEYKDRLERAYRFNHTREIVELVQKYLFKGSIIRKDDAPKELKDFWANCTRSGLTIDQYIRIISTATSILGRVLVFVDSTKTDDAVSQADEKEQGARVYTYFVRPQNILDMGFHDDDGELLWVFVQETYRDDKDPIYASGKVKVRYRLWTRNEWMLFEIKDVRGSQRVDLLDQGPVAIGRVPCFFADHILGENLYSASGLIDDIAYLDRASANYLSNLDAIIQDQAFSQLAMPAQNVLPGTEAHNALVDMGTKRIFLYDGEGGAAPEYLSPDPRQAQLIITAINKIVAEIYNTAGASGERTKQDNAVGIDNSSGVAKAYDFDKLNSLLTTKAQSLEQVEHQLNELVLLWHKATPLKERVVKYPETFDVRSLFDEFTVAQNLGLIEAPKTIRSEQMKQIVDKLFPGVAEEIKAKMLAELKSWPVDPVERAKQMFEATSPPTGFPAPGGSNASGSSKSPPKNAGKANQQGQVTDKDQKKTAA
ncbi:hypothetical protein [Methylobacterium sp. AMS5]|uniref:hypothetical protein n=1 Tax=Methylobacterium sp. AMS5 TaxID=925818 RepID=UPI00074F8C19|nr:hypothetical protein [Methylobacterium sp. AMS5]AMB48272.1 hypothetical protein Y590_25225 [Methylobacterium sp. AMS5]